MCSNGGSGEGDWVRCGEAAVIITPKVESKSQGPKDKILPAQRITDSFIIWLTALRWCLAMISFWVISRHLPKHRAQAASSPGP